MTRFHTFGRASESVLGPTGSQIAFVETFPAVLNDFAVEMMAQA
jgi:hypothetical protein